MKQGKLTSSGTIANKHHTGPTARNNLRAMKKGDLAFFYHSNCKEPGIVGTMEVVREHSPDREYPHTTQPILSHLNLHVGCSVCTPS